MAARGTVAVYINRETALKRGVFGEARERNYVADIRHARHEQHQALEAQAEAGVGRGAGAGAGDLLIIRSPLVTALLLAGGNKLEISFKKAVGKRGLPAIQGSQQARKFATHYVLGSVVSCNDELTRGGRYA